MGESQVYWPVCLFAVVPFDAVYNKSMCRPREILVEVQQEYPEDIEYIFIPSCVVLMRCAGCCNDEILECTPTATHNITMEVSVTFLSLCLLLCEWSLHPKLLICLFLLAGFLIVFILTKYNYVGH